MRTFPDNPPVSLLGLVMAPKASCSWKTQKPQSWEVPLKPHLIRLNSSEGGHGCPFPCASPQPPLSPGHFLGDSLGLKEVVHGGELFPTTFLPCFMPGKKSEFGQDTWCDVGTGIPRSMLSFLPAPPPPSAMEGTT